MARLGPNPATGRSAVRPAMVRYCPGAAPGDPHECHPDHAETLKREDNHYIDILVRHDLTEHDPHRPHTGPCGVHCPHYRED